MLSMSCLLLAYSAYAVPMQLSFWDREDPCNPFPTLYIDIFVDSFFLVHAWERLLLLLLLLLLLRGALSRECARWALPASEEISATGCALCTTGKAASESHRITQKLCLIMQKHYAETLCIIMHLVVALSWYRFIRVAPTCRTQILSTRPTRRSLDPPPGDQPNPL
jgi:hypothetical protein